MDSNHRSLAGWVAATRPENVACVKLLGHPTDLSERYGAATGASE
jgi:hypothetical protein